MNQSGPLSGRRYLVAAEYVQFGGTRTYFKDLLRFYHENGAKVVAVTSFSQSDPEMAALARDLGFDLVRYTDIASNISKKSGDLRPAVWSRSVYRREVELFDRFQKDHDLDAVTLSVGTSGLFLSAAAAAVNPLIIAHGYPHGLRQRLLGKSILAPLVPHDATILAVSNYSASLFRKAWDSDRNKFSVQTIRSTCGPLAPAIPLEGRKPLVITAALIEDYKRPFDWISIASQVVGQALSSNVPEFVWLGEGSLRNAAIERAAATGHQTIRFPGWSDKTRSYYEDARVYLQTSSKESLGLSVVDALRFGLPSVVTDAGGLPEVVLNGVNGFVVPVGDVSAAAEATRELLNNDTLWKRQAQAARDLYLERFSPTAWQDSLLRAHLK